MEIILIVVGCLIALGIKGYFDKRKFERELRDKVIDSYGRIPKKSFDEGRASSLTYFSDKAEQSDCHVDDITWNDLDMDRMYHMLNSCKSAIGEEYLYYFLRNPVSDRSELEKRDKIADALMKDAGLRTELGLFLAHISGIRNISVYEYICRIDNIEKENNIGHFLRALLLLASIALIFIYVPLGIVCTFIVFLLNVISYFKEKSDIECYFSIFGYILGIIKESKKLKVLRETDKDNILTEYLDNISRAADAVAKITRGSELFINPIGSGDLLQSFLDYIRMAFHIDLILFNRTVRRFTDKKEEFETLYGNIGILDCLLATASYRAYLSDYCKPEFTEEKCLEIDNTGHPLLEEPVTNSIRTAGPVLLTGSNASGKSTFLKTIGINAILAQTLYTVNASFYRACPFKVVTSIALRDDLESGESYYIVEIKSLKRIIDLKNSDVNILCFIDEVLRGTNTVERIAASTEVLKSLAGDNYICMAATHDIELTYILEGVYSNYHFEEKIENNNVLFDYCLKTGRATSRNAIRLLGMMGYDEEIVNKAAERANAYMNTGKWT